MNFSIIIPTVKNFENGLKPCIESIIKQTDLIDKEVIVVANGSPLSAREYVESLGPPFKLIWFDNAIGAPKAYNEGIKASSGRYVVLLNDDVIMLMNHWMPLLWTPFISDPSVGITGVIKFTLPVGSTEREAFAFWCVMIKREVIEKIGYLDEIFYPFGCEDMDFCIRAVNSGYRLVQVPDDTSVAFLGERPTTEKGLFKGNFPIYHKGSVTIDEYFNHDFEKKKLLEDRNLRIIYERYGN